MRKGNLNQFNPKRARFSFYFKAPESGFSLIEVLAAILILSGVLFSVSRIISASYLYTSKIRNIYLGSELARLKLHDVEEIIKEEGLPEDEVEEEGDFTDSEYSDFKWKYSIKRVFLPLPDITSVEDGDSSTVDQAANMLSMAQGNIEDFFKERIRKLTLTVFWGNGDRESEKTVFTLFLTTKGTATVFHQYQSGKGGQNGKKTTKPGNKTNKKFNNKSDFIRPK